MTARCQNCGIVRPNSLLGGLCPRCLGRSAFGSGAPTGEVIGGYELIRELGRGGVGIVYLARQVELDRLVAVKILAAGSQAGAVADERFLREAREAARLRHPHIVAIHEVGRHEGSPFYSMDFIEGEDLAAYVARSQPDLRTAAQLTVQAARAVQHAHDHGVLHRDLKPGNLLVDGQGDTHLTDFGLVTAIDGGDGLTRPGELMGTPGYLAPEQLRGESSTATDVYGLGGVLYFLLTGRAPFVAARLPELLAAVATGDPLPPRRLDPSLPRDLDTITLRALAPAPANRYPSAEALADDLERWLASRPIEARPTSGAERLWRWAQRNQKLTAMSVALAMTALLGATGILAQWRRAEAAATDRLANLYSADLKVASNALLVGDLGTARHTLEHCPPPLRDVAWGLLWAQTAGDAESVIGSSTWTVTDLALSPDGTLAAAAAQVDGVRLWDVGHARLVAELPGTATSWWVAFSPDGRQLFTADETVKQWDVGTRELVRTFPGRSGALSPDGHTLYTCAGHRFVYEGTTGVVTAWNTTDGAKRFELPVQARAIALSHDGAKLAVSDAESVIAVYNAQDGRILLPAWPSQGRLWHLIFSPDDRTLVASGWSPLVRLWDLADVAIPPRQLAHPFNTWSTAFSPDGRELAVACSDRLVHGWDTRTWQERRTLRGHDHEVWSLAWQPDGQLLSAGRDPRVLRWPVAVRPLEDQPRHDSNSFQIVWLPGHRLATLRTTDHGSVAAITPLHAVQPDTVLPGETPLAFDPTKNLLWLWSYTHELRGRSLAGGEVTTVPWRLGGGEVLVDVPRVVPEAGLAWAQLVDGSLDLRRLKDGGRVSLYREVFSHGAVIGAALSPDGHWFVWGGASTDLQIMNLTTGERIRLHGHRYDVASVVFAPDGKSFVSGGADGFLFIWDTAAPHRRRELGRHLTSVGQLAFSPDGQVLASQEGGFGIHLWHPATAREVGFLPVPDDSSSQWLGFSREGDQLGVRLSNGEIRSFPVATRAEAPAHREWDAALAK